MQADLIHSCLHRVMAVLPEPKEGDSPQEVSVAPTVGGGTPRRYQRPLWWEVGDSPQELSAAPTVALSRGGGSQQDWQLLLFQLLYLDTVQVLKDLLTSLLQWNMTPQGLQVMVEVCGRQWHSVQVGGGL